MRALEFPATRTSETFNVTWVEFDLQAEVWTIPAVRMKARAEHRVPLSHRALVILHGSQHERESDNDYVFCGATRRPRFVEYGA